MINKIRYKLSLTSTEFNLISLVGSAFLFGLFLNLVFNLSHKSKLLEFDYSSIDSLFYSSDNLDEENFNKLLKSDFVYKQEVLDFNTAKFKNISRKVVPPEKSIDINLAKIDQLVLIPGIGEKTANAIIELRKKLGKFNKLEDLKKVKGIGDKKFEKIKKYVYIK